ncbi:flagellar biosynthesis protein FlgN, partial [Salmonella enterica]|nr:flagellar biosynthesis protein FlgN [Salmonella enterica]
KKFLSNHCRMATLRLSGLNAL